MNLSIELTQEQYDCVNRVLNEDLTPEQWLQSAFDGKLNNCLKRENPEQVANALAAKAESENIALRAIIAELKK